VNPRPPARASTAWRHVGALALVAGAIVFTYANARHAGFVFDGRVLVLENPIVHRATWENVRFLLTHDYWQPMGADALYRPLTVLTYLVDWTVLGHADRAVGYVAENVGLHLACAALVYALVWRLARRRWPATVAALIFGVHPLTTEAVTNVVGRADLLASLGVLAGVLAWARAATAHGSDRVAWALVLSAAAVVAFFAKESGLVLVAAIALYDVAFPPTERRRMRIEYGLVALLLAGYVAARCYVAWSGLPAEDVSPVDNPIAEAGVVAGRSTALAVVTREIGLVLWPATLSVDYSWRQIPLATWPPTTATDFAAVVGLAGVALAVWALVRVRPRRPDVFFLGALAAVALLPTANLVVVIGSIMAERFLYLPLAAMAGVAALLADGVAGTGGRRAAVTAVAVVVGALAVRAAVRNADWRDNLVLWSATVRAVPESAKAQKAFAAALFAADPDGRDLDRVIAAAERAVALRPDYEQALADAGGYLVTKGDRVAASAPDEARGWYEKAVASLERARAIEQGTTDRFIEKMRARGRAPDAIPDVGDSALHGNLALAYVRTARLDDALAEYETVCRLEPLDPTRLLDVAAVLVRLGRWEDAAVTLFEAVAVAPGDRRAPERLAELYRTFRAGAVAADSSSVRIDVDDPFVRRHRCRSWRELANRFARAQLQTAAADAHREAVERCTGE
jgi:tetratricopeptide (TPR) repeat protein